MAIALSMAAMAFLITIVLGYPYLTYLRRAGLGKKVRIEGPSTHIEKTGTPTIDLEGISERAIPFPTGEGR